MNINILVGYIILLFHGLFIIAYIAYIFYGEVTKKYINIICVIFIALLLNSILYDGCFLTKIEQYLWDDYEWKGITYETYKNALGVDNNYETMKYSFIGAILILYITFINRVRLHKNSLSGRYFNLITNMIQ